MPDAHASSDKLPYAHANRHAWALEKCGHLLLEAVRKDTSAEARTVEKLPEAQIPGRVVSLILEKADPTHNKGMTAWLVAQYAQGKLRLEDLGTANETLTMFRRYAQRLEPSQRDLGQYPSLAAVWEAVIAFANAEEQHISGKAQKALDRDKAYAESRILRQDQDGFTVAVPLTEFAAKWWGRGTRWCTAAEKNNRFWQYHKKAPLFVVIIPELKETGKFQIWVTEGDVQFMDAADNPVSKVVFTEYLPRFAPVIAFALQQSGLALEHVPRALRTDEMCRSAVGSKGLALEYVPQKLRTDEMCRIAVAQNGWALEHVPKDLRTDEMCSLAVTQIGWALEYVPQKLRTEETCRIAVTQSGWALECVPEAQRSEVLCRIAVAQNGDALKYVPQKLRTEDMCSIAVAQYGLALAYVPQKLLKGEMYKIAVAQDGLALRYVPLAARTVEFCRMAVEQNGLALQYVPDELCTEDMCRIAVARDGLALHDVPESLRTEEICRIAVAQDGGALCHVPQTLRTEEMCRITVAQNGKALEHVPKVLRSEDVCKIAVAQKWRAFRDVPETLRTYEICRLAVAQDVRALEHVPEALQSAMQQFVKPPQPTWDLAILDQWAEAMGPTIPLVASTR